MHLNRELNITVTKQSRIACSRYTDLDEIVIHKMTELGIPLIGGTALEIWAKVTNTPNVRKRSDNDIDGISSDLYKVSQFNQWASKNIDPDKVETDIMLVRSHDFTPWITVVDGILIMKPEYLLWSKLTRRTEKDRQDIKWILSIDSLSDEDIQYVLDTLGLTQEEADFLNSILQEL